MKAKHSPIILAIDPGFDRVGWAVGYKDSNKAVVSAYGLIQTNSKAPLFDRYQQINTEIKQIIQQHQPQACAIERLFFARNKTTALKVAEARGVIIITAMQSNLSISEHTPNEIKLAVAGFGNADKTAMTKMVKLQLNLTKEKIIDDVIDALAVLLTASLKNNLL